MSPFISAVFILFAVVTCLLVAPIQSANVLCLLTSSGKSQLIVFMAVANTLIERGHNLTIITTIKIPPQSQPIHPYRHILLQQKEETAKLIDDNLSEITEESTSRIRAMVNLLTLVGTFATTQTEAVMRKKFQEFLQEDNHFDLLLLGYYNNDYLVGVAARYRCPIALVTLGSPYGPISRLIGNPEETTYVQFPMFGKSQPMTFLQRLTNFLYAVVEPVAHTIFHYLMEAVYKRIFTDEFYPSFSDMVTNISLVLTNSHFSEMPVRPLVPALVEIGGIQYKEHPEPLPEDIQAFLDSSTNGAILFNVGSKTRGTLLDPDKVEVIINAFSKLNLNVLWEWDESLPKPKRPNFLFRQGLPQDGILAHNNCRIFVTDGRQKFIFDAQYRGVPMIGMPLIVDEPFNVEGMTSKGYGVSLDVNVLTEEALQEAVKSVLYSPFYRGRVKRFSQIYRDRPTTAAETAAFWLEYVMRYQGAPHMQSPLVKMSFVQMWNIDVIFVIWIVLYVFFKLAKLIEVIVRKILQVWACKRMRFRKYKFS